jgi:outer membrane lipoprotein LolB
MTKFQLVSDSTIGPIKWMCLILLLTACSTAPVHKEVGYSRSAIQSLNVLEPWSLQGRLSVADENDSWQAEIFWEHLPGMDQIKLSGPVGQGAVVIHLTKNFVTVSRGDGVVESSDQPEEFINQQVGLAVPIRSLRYWVIGLPMPGPSFDEVIGGFKQSGWLVDYQQMQMVNGKPMPRKITVKNDQVKLKLFIDQWIFNEIEAN